MGKASRKQHRSPKMPERTMRDLSRWQRLGIWWMAWRRARVDALVCAIRDHQWSAMHEYKTNRLMKGWRSCRRCWLIEDTRAAKTA